MALKHMKRCSTSLLEKCKSKPQWDITSHLSEWASLRSLQINTGEGVEKREPSYPVAIFAISLSLTLKITTKGERESEVAQSCPALCDPMDGSLPGSSVYGILQARILEWVAISFSRRYSQPKDWTRVSHIVGRCFTIWATKEGKSPQSFQLNILFHFLFLGVNSQDWYLV